MIVLLLDTADDAKPNAPVVVLCPPAGLSPEQLPALVEHTPMLAYELLLRLLRSRHIHAYFQVGPQSQYPDGIKTLVLQLKSSVVA
jgi:hypothetical protein